MTDAAPRRPRPLGLAPANQPPPSKVQIVTRIAATDRESIRALAEAEGVTMQQLGVYAWRLALREYGWPTLAGDDQ